MLRPATALLLKIALLLGGLLAWLCVVYIVDPDQQWRFSDTRTRSKLEPGEERQLYPGIARNFTGQALILGTSTSQNMLAGDVKRFFHQDAVNITLQGATAKEQLLLLRQALANPKVKTIFLALDLFSFSFPPGYAHVTERPVVEEPSPAALARYAFNLRSIKNILRLALMGRNPRWHEHLGYWGYLYRPDPHRWETIDVARNAGCVYDIRKPYTLESMLAGLTPIMAELRAAKDKEIILFFPPYSILWWAFSEDCGKLDTYLAFKRAAIEQIGDQPHIRCYDFQCVPRYVTEMSGYKDIVHCAPTINRALLMDMAADKHRLTPANLPKIEQIRTLLDAERPFLTPLLRNPELDAKVEALISR